ncbi:CpsB/CapC family capsule biosynthesis tyrosine phosphatase [Halobacillus andaensis]|uniref:CpsB/CapC family capsule biosynthesis tyrosine phosphatase n=1 Tax=Halobacillus andaensis TaxID=1176239 RepID=UPI003D725B15
MIDIHTHIIPGVDEGIQTIEDSIELAREAAKEGIHTIVATPTYQDGINLYSKNDVLTYVQDINKHLQKRLAHSRYRPAWTSYQPVWRHG